MRGVWGGEEGMWGGWGGGGILTHKTGSVKNNRYECLCTERKIESECVQGERKKGTAVEYEEKIKLLRI